jgi:hypothetical protein
MYVIIGQGVLADFQDIDWGKVEGEAVRRGRPEIAGQGAGGFPFSHFRKGGAPNAVDRAQSASSGGVRSIAEGAESPRDERRKVDNGPVMRAAYRESGL